MMNKYITPLIISLTILLSISLTFDKDLSSLKLGALSEAADGQIVSIKAMQAERRVALVIGNGAYKSSPLKNPVNDALAMAQVLKGLNFEVISGVNLNKDEMMKLVIAFGNKIKDGGVGLFYFAGHGVQYNGQNFLIPINAIIDSQEVIEVESMSADYVLARMDAAKNRLNIVILDACRNNPFARSFRSIENGLAQMKAGRGTFIAYATAPGSTASDGDGEHGLFTQELIRNMQRPGLKIEEMFKDVRAAVQNTNNKQTPWESSSLTGDFYFKIDTNESVSNKPTAQTAAIVVKPDQEHWETIKDSIDISDFIDFINEHPKSNLIPAAQAKIKQLKKTQQNGQEATAKGIKIISNDKNNKDVQPSQNNIKSGANTHDTAQQSLMPAEDNLQGEITDINDDEGITDANAQYLQGVIALYHKDYNKAFGWFKKSALQGNANAYFKLGTMYRRGLGVNKDIVKAISLFLKSCKGGHIDAVNNLKSIRDNNSTNQISELASAAISKCQDYERNYEIEGSPQNTPKSPTTDQQNPVVNSQTNTQGDIQDTQGLTIINEGPTTKLPQTVQPIKKIERINQQNFNTMELSERNRKLREERRQRIHQRKIEHRETFTRFENETKHNHNHR